MRSDSDLEAITISFFAGASIMQGSNCNPVEPNDTDPNEISSTIKPQSIFQDGGKGSREEDNLDSFQT